MSQKRNNSCIQHYPFISTVWIPAFVLLIILAGLCLPTQTMAKVRAPKMNCKAYVVMDAGTGEVLFGQNVDKKIFPASTAKLMTAIVCIENGDVNSNIKTSSDVLSSTTPGAYCLGLNSGVTFTFKDLLSFSLISSAADATDSLAVAVFGSKEACAEAMNAKSRELGLTQTSFDNPVGNDIGAGFDNTYSTAREMALITRYAMAVPLIRETVGKSHYEASRGQEIYANSTNWFLRGNIDYDSDRYHIIGSKSGTTLAAGHVFIATATDDEGHEVICGYFGAPDKERTFVGIRRLLNYTFQKYDKGQLSLSPKCDDVRASDMRELYETYVSLHTYPVGKDGRFHPDSPINRTQFARLIKNIDATEAYPGLGTIARCFAGANKKGCVTVSTAASFIQDIYPAHMSDKKVKKTLADCRGTEALSKKEKEAYAIFINSGLMPDDSCKNAQQKLTRKQALILADKLADYQIGYAARHIIGDGNLLSQSPLEDQAPPLLLNSKWKRIYGFN